MMVSGDEVEVQDRYFLIIVHAGIRCFAVLGPATIEHERVVVERIADLQSRGHAIGLALDFESDSIEQAVRRAMKATSYVCVGVWSLDRRGEPVSCSVLVP